MILSKMKSDILILTVILVLSLIALAAIGIGILSLLPSQDVIYEENCRMYERAGVIPVRSCSCSEQLFDRWSHSYDWMDACAILEARKR